VGCGKRGGGGGGGGGGWGRGEGGGLGGGGGGGVGVVEGGVVAFGGGGGGWVAALDAFFGGVVGGCGVFGGVGWVGGGGWWVVWGWGGRSVCLCFLSCCVFGVDRWGEGVGLRLGLFVVVFLVVFCRTDFGGEVLGVGFWGLCVCGGLVVVVWRQWGWREGRRAAAPGPREKKLGTEGGEGE